MTALPVQVFEPFGWENPMPTLPTTQLSLKEQKRTGHIFAKCPMPLPTPDTKAANAPEACEFCLDTLRVCREQGEAWHALQQKDAAIWRVRGIELKADGNTVPFPGKLPTPEHAAALGSDYSGPTTLTPSLKVVPEDRDEDEADHIPPPPPPPNGNGDRQATDNQVKFLVDLAVQKRPEWVNKIGLDTVRERAALLTFKDASARIDALKAEPDAGVAKQMKRGPVVAGRYALPVVKGDEEGNDLAFYRIDCPTTGKWAGYTFVKRIIGGHTDENVPRAQAPGILARIKDDEYLRPGTDEYRGAVFNGAEAGQMRYADHFTKCWMCNTELTNKDSRARGIGPTCAAK